MNGKLGRGEVGAELEDEEKIGKEGKTGVRMEEARRLEKINGRKG